MIMNKYVGFVAVGMLFLCALPSQAATVQVFQGPLGSTLSAFQAATGATSVVGAGFPKFGLVSDGTLDTEGGYAGPAHFSYLSPSTQLYSGVADGGYTDIWGNNFTDWTSLLSGPDLALSGSENLLAVNLPTPTYSVGFEFVDPTQHSPGNPGPNTATVYNSKFSVTLLNGLTTVYTFDYIAAVDTAYFIGAWSDTAFDSVKILETYGGDDNEYFNRFYAGATPNIPEPSTLLLLGTGTLFSVAGRFSGRRWIMQ